MSNDHKGNVLNQIAIEEHDGDNNAKRVNVVGGNITLDTGDIEIGAVELKNATDDTRAKIKSDGTDNALVVTQNSLPTVKTVTKIVDATGAEMDLFKQGDNFAVGGDHGLGILGLSDGTPQKYAFIRVEGVSDDGETPLTAGALSTEAYNMVYNGTTFDRMRGNITDGVLVNLGSNNDVTITDSKGFIGLATVQVGTIAAGTNRIGKVRIADANDVADASVYAVTGDNNSALAGLTVYNNNMVFDGSTWDRARGDSTDGLLVNLGNNNDVTLKGNVTIADSKGFIGLTTVTGNINIGGSGKTWQQKNIALDSANTSGATIFVGASSTDYYITNIMLNSNATVGVAIMSGVTYLVGNASLRVKLNPAGGWVESGSPDSPIYKSLNQQQSFSIVTDTAVAVVGHVTYYEE